MRIVSRNLVHPIVAAAALTLAVDGAAARTPFDGAWLVMITTQSGTCGSGLGFGVQIRDGEVVGYGGFEASGRVEPDGSVMVRLSQGDSNATGSGHLSAKKGGGTWQGEGSRGECTGTWSASRNKLVPKRRKPLR